MKNIASQLKMFAMTCLIATTLAACVKDTTPAASTTSISGQAIAGTVDGTVTVRNAAGTQLATATVSNGAFTVTLNDSDLGQELDFEVTGSYRDEVSGQTVTLTTANPLALRIAANHFVAGQAGNAPVTPGSTVIREMMVQNQLMTLTEAQTAFQNAFGYAPNLAAVPFEPYGTIPGGATVDPANADQNAAFRVGMFSQFGTDLGLTAADLAELPAKLAADLADGTLDGVDGLSSPVTFTSGANLQALHQIKPLGNRLIVAIGNFSGNTTANIAGVKAPSMGLPPILADSSGTTKTIALNDGTLVDVQVSVIAATAPFQSNFRQARTRHQITLTYNTGGGAVDITADPKVTGLALKPWMYMNSGMGHPTEMTAVDTTNAATGVYIVDAYYRMASGMNNMPMGQWQLNVQLTDGTNGGAFVDAFFFPNVMMVMDMGAGLPALRATGSNAADQWTKMGMTVPRTYAIWLKDIVNNGNGTFNVDVFVATQNMNMMMMSFPGVAVGTALTGPMPMGGGMAPALTVAAVTLNVSADGGTTWNPMTPVAGGVYTIAGLSGANLTGLAASTLDFQLSVDIGAGANDMSALGLQHTFTAP